MDEEIRLKKKIIFRSILILFACILSFGTAELLLRLFSESKDSDQQVPIVTHKGYRTYPRQYEFAFINEEGFKIQIETDEYGLRNPRGTLAKADVIVLGDSFILSLNTPREQTMVGRLAESGTKVYNAGMRGHSTFNELHLLRDLIDKSKPKTVILAFYSGNDFRDNYFDQLILPNSGQQSTNTSLGFGSKIKAMILSLGMKSAVFTYCYTHIYYGLIRGRASQIMPSYSLSEMVSLSLSYIDNMEIAVQKTNTALSEFAKLAKEKDFELYIVGIPSKAQVYQSFHDISHFYSDKHSKKYALDLIKKGYSFDQPDKIARKLSENNGIKYISLLHLFRKNLNKKLYYHIDLHWTPIGQQLAAEHLMQTLFKLQKNATQSP